MKSTHSIASVCSVILAHSLSLLHAAPITSLTVSVATCDVALAGTDNDVSLHVVLENQTELSWNLDTPDHDDFERGQTDEFTLTGFFIEDACKIQSIRLHKTEDDVNGGWKLDAVTISTGGSIIYSESNVNQWLENDVRDWYASRYVPAQCPAPFLPPPPPTCMAPITACRALHADEKEGTQIIDSDCDGIPDMCDAQADPQADSDNDGIPDVYEDPNAGGANGSCATNAHNPDTDGDGVLDGAEDSDGDGLYDWWEDMNANCIVDAGESDPHSADSDGDGVSDAQEDADADGILDYMEAAWGTDPNSHDTDEDGWFDGPRNLITRVFLSAIQCVEAQETFFDDEIFVTFNHTRWPPHDKLDGTWRFDSDFSHSMSIKAATRIWSPHMDPAPQYFVRLAVREDDMFDWSDDDLAADKDVQFTHINQVFDVAAEERGYKYVLTFRVVSTWFSDPHPLVADIDSDMDGQDETTEHTVAAYLNGLGDLTVPDVFMELDWQTDQEPARYTKEAIVSRFAYRGYAFHLDDGVFGGGGEVGPIGETGDDVSFFEPSPSLNDYRTQYFDATQRINVFRYALAVESVKDAYGWSSGVVKDENGQILCKIGDRMIFEDADFLNGFSSIEAIVWIHEFGHTLGLCHPPGDGGSVAVGPGGEGGCICCGDADCNCTHYSVDESSTTAMGSGFKFPWITDAIHALRRDVDYDDAEWKALDMTTNAKRQRIVLCE